MHETTESSYPHTVFHNVRLREVEGHALRLPRRDRRLPAQDPAQVSQLQGGRHGGGTA